MRVHGKHCFVIQPGFAVVIPIGAMRCDFKVTQTKSDADTMAVEVEFEKKKNEWNTVLASVPFTEIIASAVASSDTDPGAHKKKLQGLRMLVARPEHWDRVGYMAAVRALLSCRLLTLRSFS